MTLLLGYNSAWHFWRSVYPSDRTPGRSGKSLPAPEDLIPNKNLLSSLPLWAQESEDGESKEAHLIVRRPQDRRAFPGVQCHIWKGNLANNACFKLTADAQIASPAFSFLMASQTLSLPELIAYGDELCGLYSFSIQSEQGFRTRLEPLVTKRQLIAFLEKAIRAPGVTQARLATKYIVERSASPMETFVEMLLSLPCRYGGYGLDAPRMNRRIELGSRSSAIAHKEYCVGDLCYPEFQLDIEYHGKRYHDSDLSFLADRRRINGLRDAGYEVIELTYDQVVEFGTFEALALSIAKKLGKRIYRKHTGALPQRIALRKTLLEWNQSLGAISSR